MMHKCIIVKVGKARKRKRTKIGGIYKFSLSRENMQYASLVYGRWTPLVQAPMHKAGQLWNYNYTEK